MTHTKVFRQSLASGLRMLPISALVGVVGIALLKGTTGHSSMDEIVTSITVPACALYVMVRFFMLLPDQTQVENRHSVRDRVLLGFGTAFSFSVLVAVLLGVSLAVYWMLGLGWAVAGAKRLLYVGRGARRVDRGGNVRHRKGHTFSRCPYSAI